MKLLKKIAVVAALSSIASYASALTPIADKDLSAVSGRDGVSIAADLHVKIGDFTYTNTNTTNGGSVSFNNIKISGTFGMTLDVISGAAFSAAAFNPGTTAGSLGIVAPVTTPAPDAQAIALSSFYPTGSDVVKIAIPNIAVGAGHELNMSVDSITMGNSTASFGKMALNNIQLQGTTVYIWAHN